IQLLKRRKDLTAGVGLILPLRRWHQTSPDIQWTELSMEKSIRFLLQSKHFVYNETGFYEISSRRIDIPVLLAPMSEKTLKYAMSLKKSVKNDSEILTFGFFGSPKTAKGFETIIEAVHSTKLSQKRQIRFFVPKPSDCRVVQRKLDTI